MQADHAVILIVEDREDDIVLMRRALTKGYISHPIQIVRDGDEAIAYLKGEGKYANREEFPLPALVLLDLKMPRVDGFEVLEWIRSQPELNTLRVVVLTSSDAMRDVNRAYQLGANSFLVKPLDFENFIHLTRQIKQYWLSADQAPTVERPPRSNPARVEEDS